MSVMHLMLSAGVQPTQARAFAPVLEPMFERFGITTPVRQAAFIAQAAHESAKFTRLEESLWYSTPERIRAVFPSRVPSLQEAARLVRNPQALANRVYSNRLGNGDEASGDGWKYRGRGIFQLTGRANYMAAGDALNFDYKGHPELVATIDHACLTACWFWSTIRGNEAADVSDIDAITRRVNGPAMMAADERRSIFDDLVRLA